MQQPAEPLAGTSLAALQDKFCAIIMPAVERHAAVAFRGHGAEARQVHSERVENLPAPTFLRGVV